MTRDALPVIKQKKKIDPEEFTRRAAEMRKIWREEYEYQKKQEEERKFEEWIERR